MLYTDSGSPIPNDKPMEQFKASDEDWREIENASRFSGRNLARTVRELRDRVAALEAASDRVLVCNQTGEYLKAGTPLYLDSCNRLVSYSAGEARPLEECGKDHAVLDPAAQAAVVLSDEEIFKLWDDAPGTHRQSLRVVWDHGYEQGLAAGRAEQQATKAVRVVLPETPCYPDLVSGGVYYLHGYDDAWAAARAMVEQQQAAQSDPGMATPEPEPSPSPAADGGLEDVIAGIIGNEPIIGRPCPAAGAVILAVAKWLRSMGHFSAATNLEREANR